MLFSSLIFLFVFLPISLLGYYIVPRPLKNYWLLLASLIFFAWGGVSYTIILVGSIIINYFFGLLIERNIQNKAGYLYLFAGVTTNILLLGIFKYFNFITSNINDLLMAFSIEKMQVREIDLPIGISFYTFHSLSYLVDIYCRKTTAQKNIFDLSLYIAMFSQLIAGPIIRYSDVWQQLKNRAHSPVKFASGIERFTLGLAKKVLLANTFAKVADDIFSQNANDLGALNGWLGIICYTLQIYYDFAGYSDMAIGLGRMFGFEFMENFNFPYIAQSVKEFWRRWHISLSTFFRDYVYIPLGGNRGKEGRTYLNLIIVFFLTGFWHGASWSFVIWGLFHGFFMLLEKAGFEKILLKAGKPLSNLYTLLVVMFAWVLFRSDTLTYAVGFWNQMLSLKCTIDQKALFMSFMNSEFFIVSAIGIAGALGFFPWFTRVFIDKAKFVPARFLTASQYGYHSVIVIFYSVMLLMSIMYLVAGTYNPFIYYKF